MTIDLDRLRELAEAATPGEWSTPTGDYVWAGEVQIAARDEERDFAQASADMRFIAAANPATIIELLDRLSASEKEQERMRHEVGSLAVRVFSLKCQLGDIGVTPIE